MNRKGKLGAALGDYLTDPLPGQTSGRTYVGHRLAGVMGEQDRHPELLPVARDLASRALDTPKIRLRHTSHFVTIVTQPPQIT